MSEPGLVAPTIGRSVGVHERPEQALTDTLAEQLRARHLLLVLDNCEHLVEACAELVGSLSSVCPQLHMMATSRAPLVVDGEATFEVAPLPVPDPDAVSASAVAAADAARLFEVRARQVAADFRIGDDKASAVAEICRRLDGIPLAIELAAARVRVLAPGQIAAGLSDRLRLLTGGRRGAHARQRTLEASLDWSYDLLDDVQRLALARLSAFAGSFELDAAEAVAEGEGIHADDVLDLLAGLVEQSLARTGPEVDEGGLRVFMTAVAAKERVAAIPEERFQEFVGNVGPLKAQLRARFPHFGQDDAKSIRVPTLLVSGPESPAPLTAVIDKLEELLPDVSRLTSRGRATTCSTAIPPRSMPARWSSSANTDHATRTRVDQVRAADQILERQLAAKPRSQGTTGSRPGCPDL